MGSGFAKKKKQMRALQEQFNHIQAGLSKLIVTGSAGNGLVTLQLNGDYEIASLTIKPECVDPEDVEGLIDLVKAAHADALTKLQAETSRGMPDLSSLGSLGL